MANVYLNTLIMKALSSAAYFTRVDESKAMAEDKELMQIHPDLYKNKLSKFDSPNNIKGVFITTSGIYVETYNGYGTLDKQNGKPKREGVRIRFDKDANTQWVNLVNEFDNGQRVNTNYNNNWMFSPVL